MPLDRRGQALEPEHALQGMDMGMHKGTMNVLAGHRPSDTDLDWRYFSAENNYATSSAASASEADLEADVETEGLDFEYDDETQPSESNEPFAPQLLLRRHKSWSRSRGIASANSNSNFGQESRRAHLSAATASPKATTSVNNQTSGSAREADDSTDTIKNLRARALDRMNRRGSTTLEGEGTALAVGGGVTRKPSSSLSSSPRVSKTSDDTPRGLRRISDNGDKPSLTRQSSLRSTQASQQQQSQGSRAMRYESPYQPSSLDQEASRQRGTGTSARFSQQPGLGLVSEDESQSESTFTRGNVGSLAMERSRRVMMDELKSLKARVEELEMERMSRSLSLGNNVPPLSSSSSLSRPQAIDLRAGPEAKSRSTQEKHGGEDGDHGHESPLRSPVSSQMLRKGEQDAVSSTTAATLSRKTSLRKERMTRPHSRQSSAAMSAAAFASTQHVELLKDAFDFFEKTINHSVELLPSEHAIPSVQGMARIVSHALSMNQTIRAWVKADVSLVESSSMQALLRACDDQIRSLTESLLSTANLIAELEARSMAPPQPPTATLREAPYPTPSSPIPQYTSSANVVPRSPRGSATASSIYRSANLADGHSTPSLGGYTSAGEDSAHPAGRIRGVVRQTWHPSGYESAGSVSSFGQAAMMVASSVANAPMGRSNSDVQFRANLHQHQRQRQQSQEGSIRRGYTSDYVSHDRNGSMMSSGSSAMARSETLPARRELGRAVGGTGGCGSQHQNQAAFRPQDEDLDVAEQDPSLHSQQQQMLRDYTSATAVAVNAASQQRAHGATSPRLSQILRKDQFSGIEQRLSGTQSPVGDSGGGRRVFPNPSSPTVAEQFQQQQQQQPVAHDSVTRRQASVRQLMAKYSANSPTSIFFGTAGNGSLADGGQQEMQAQDLTVERNRRELSVGGTTSIQERRQQQHNGQETLQRSRISDLHLAQPTMMERRAQMQQQHQQQAQHQQHQHRGSSDMTRQRPGGGRYASMAQSMVDMQHADMQMSTPAISSASSSPSSSRVDGQSVGSHRVMTPDSGIGGTVVTAATGVITQQMLSPRGKGVQQHHQQVYKMGHPKTDMSALQQQQQQHHRLSNKMTLY
ncbi:hypothetical protein BGZ73_008715 [Actinomortierella ambigua]|nr:hypothetical protein BGZ73_008715 [Actinomortierella ambigua]